MANVNDMEIPKAPSDYLKLEEWSVKVHVLSPDFVEWFIDFYDKKSVYYRKDECPEKAINPEWFVYFRACVVWNYEATKGKDGKFIGRIQLREIKSKQIMNKIKELCTDADRGKELDYDLKITKKGVKKETKYEVTPSKKWPVAKAIQDEFEKADITLEKLFEWLEPMKK